MQSKNKFPGCRPTELSRALLACPAGGTALALACALSLTAPAVFAYDEPIINEDGNENYPEGKMSVDDYALQASDGYTASLTVKSISIDSTVGAASAEAGSTVILSESGYTESITVTVGSEESPALMALAVASAGSDANVTVIADSIDISVNSEYMGYAVNATTGTVILGDSNSTISISTTATYDSAGTGYDGQAWTMQALGPDSYVEVNGQFLTISADSLDSKAILAMNVGIEQAENNAKVVINSDSITKLPPLRASRRTRTARSSSTAAWKSKRKT